MKIISYNVNGIRAAQEKGLTDWLQTEQPDILCIQETKAQPDQIDLLSYQAAGYHTYCHSAEKKGYSGVALFCKQKPENVTIGSGNEEFDREGRIIKADFKDFTQICVYIPSGTTGDVRQEVKMRFLDFFKKYIDSVRSVQPKIVVSGDFNICHKPIDINHPEKHLKTSGFLPEERQWVDEFIESGMIDSFRQINRLPEQYSWWSYRSGARQKNLGWRIDYHFIGQDLLSHLVDAKIHANVVHSDHCPIELVLDL